MLQRPPSRGRRALTITSTARVLSERPRVLLEQLCEHFAHERGRHGAPGVEVTFDDDEGFVNFAPVIDGTCRLDAREQGALVLTVSGSDRAALERVQGVLGDHVARFGEGDGSAVEWTPPAEPTSTG